jgi:hypothetical protein
MDSSGRLAVMWRNWLGGSRDMYAALSSDGGRTFTPGQKLGAGTWKLNGCPMDGGAIAFDGGGKVLTAWRREKTVFTAALAIEDQQPAAVDISLETNGNEEQQLAKSAVQPLVIVSGNVAYRFWESDSALMLQRGNDDPRRLAEQASFASAASLPQGGAVVVWESRAGGVETLLAATVK